MRELRPTAEEPVGPAGGPLTARDAARAAEAELRRVLDENVRRARATDPVFAREVAERVRALVRRGGKRLRPAFAWCGWRAAGGSGCAAPVLRTGAALELVQACALVHDDVMDGSALRRGAPAVQVQFARLHEAEGLAGPAGAFASAAAVLAGDLALAWADDLLAGTALRSPHGPRLLREWRAMRGEMVAGQYRDVRAQAGGAAGLADAVVVATLKSALYTVARPLALGAALAGGDAAVLGPLRDAGRCAGLAFQLRDDLLGAFGDSALTGKPADDDLRTRKLTCLLAVGIRLAEVSGDREASDVLGPRGPSSSVSGDDNGNGDGDGVRRMRAALERTGARAVVEATVAGLAEASLRHFRRTGADRTAREEFAALVERASGARARYAGEAA